LAREVLIVEYELIFILLATSIHVSVDSQQFLAWMVAGSVVFVLLVATAYRVIARTFDLGPRDT
jgi:hypothetical protein